jgi:hypothetical protein
MSLPRNPEVSKKWFCYVGNENHMRLAGETWVDSQRHNNYHFLPKNKPIFDSVKENDILMIYCHGSPSTPSTVPVLWLKNFNKEPVKDLETNEVTIPKELGYTPEKFLEFLISQKLNADHKILKLAACYSDNFAEQLSTACKSTFPYLTVIGYSDQLLLGQGVGGNILAGLKVPLVKQDRDEEDRQGNEPVNWMINEAEFLKNRDSYKRIYDEERQQVKFRGGIKLVEDKPELNIEQKSSGNSGTQIRSSPRHSHTASRSSVDLSISPQSDDKIATENLGSRRSSTSNIAGLLNLSLSSSGPRVDLQASESTINNRVAIRTTHLPNPLPNRAISSESADKKANFDQEGKNDIIDIPMRRKTM